MYQNKKVAFFTLGCKLNYSETSTLARKFEQQGFTRVDFKEEADVYVVNSCSVTEQSDKKSRNIIRQAIRRNPKALVAVVGCYAQLRPDAIASINGVDLILGTHEKYSITERLGDLTKKPETEIFTSKPREQKQFHQAYSYGDRTRSFLKVQDGCNYFCTYCTIPMARGVSRNDTIANTVAEAEKIASNGIKEIILTGINIGDFGRSTGERFIDLIKELDKVEGIERFRISSIEPNLLEDEIIEFVSQSRRFAPHFHIPLQSGSDDVLHLMKRRYTRDIFAHRVETIKKLMPHAFIGVDLIAGTNGETEEFFLDSYNFIRDLDVTQLHAFPYSERPNTQALNIQGPVSVDERRNRCQQLIELSGRKLHHFYEQHLGTKHNVLFESQRSKGKMFGFTDNYIRVELPYNAKLINQIHTVELIGINANGHVDIRLIEGEGL
ncbi:MAG: tRNA (N(6)-L-threonylcarbamoyladenosine(37)-C(2))-methylthiotransferase MtaB [Bacteroidota bacterium]|nr:tRNA (N(6)-L-threonylcarbamoyladenosine(37)-C(2))-methylthiotransferase MtaB [Bacteroidota bacterium]MDP4206187.1 tRNA (N(6)-L-threonylcarbamoyladenosine(37)-C(2))-methylthiotransferase MtaB [Bacteroidota bacterium]